MSGITPRTSKRSRRSKVPFGEQSFVEEDGDSNFGQTDSRDTDKSNISGLKLVLKVSNSSKSLDMSTVGSETEDSDAERKLKSIKKKKKVIEKRKRGADISGLLSDDEATTTSRFAATDDGTSMMTGDGDQSQQGLAMRNRDRRQIPEDEKTPLRRCLEYLRNQLDRKDTNGFFAFPVTDAIAPGYSSVISHPMDFNTMLNKIEKAQYANVMEFKEDFELMMNNCMTYNHPETVYYKEAKRLLIFGQKLLSKERLVQLRRTLPYMSQISAAELGYQEDSTTANSVVIPTVQTTISASLDSIVVTPAAAPVTVAPVTESQNSVSMTSKRNPVRFEAEPDDMTPEEILKQAEAAASAAAGRLTLRAPNSKMGFIRRKDDGSTSFCIVNPDNDGIVSEKEKIVTLGAYIGKLTSGSGSVLVLKEDKRNKANPVNYLDYGSFSSYAPFYDSSTANISKEDSDLLLSTYYDETGVQYANSIRHFVENSGDYAVSMVDSLLDLLTSGEHSKTMNILKERDEERMRSNISAEWNNLISDVKNELDNKVDLSFLENLGNVASSEEDNPIIQQQLNLTSKLLSELFQTQYQRLSQKLPENLAQIPGPSPTEVNLAQSVTSNLTKLVKQVTPGDIVGVDQLRAVMGISDTYSQANDDSTSTAMIVDDNTASADSQKFNHVTGDPALISQSYNSVIQDNISQSTGTGSSVMFETSTANNNSSMSSTQPVMFSQSTDSLLAVTGVYSAAEQLSTAGQLQQQLQQQQLGGGDGFVLDPEMQELLEQSSIVCMDT